jgi:hypothetical protein
MIRVIGSGGPMAEALLRRRSNRRAMTQLFLAELPLMLAAVSCSVGLTGPWPSIEARTSTTPVTAIAVERGEHNLDNVPPKGPTQ